MSAPQFHSWLRTRFARFVALKRAGGFDYTAQARLLAGFDRYLVEHGAAPPLRAEVLWGYLEGLGELSPRRRDNAVSVVWQALAYAHRHGARVDPLPERPPSAPAWHRLREPFVLSPGQVSALLAGALELAPTRLFSRATHACLLGLLYTTGLRVGEALALEVRDLDREQRTLLVRAGKFGKERLLPLPESTVVALVRHLEHPLRRTGCGPEDPFFVSCRRRRLTYPAARQALRKAAQRAGIRDERGRAPRLHDLRHTFAVHCVLRWYREGREVNALLPVLSTYLGHVDPAHTYTYLRAAELLAGQAAQRFEALARGVCEVRS